MKHPVLNKFYEISQIPRPSHHEEKIAKYLYDWAKQRNLEVQKDEYNNLVIRKPASKGYENKSCIAIQAHMDMVCEKVTGYEHDFFSDPIRYYIDGNIVSTRNTTTLGADDGIGIAMILAILEDSTLEHPSIEAVFTVDEEDDFTGAINFDINTLKSNYLINVDHAVEDEIICSSAGGISTKVSKKLSFLNNDKNLEDIEIFKIFLTGFKGGHSGEDINKGRGNSIVALFRLIDKIKEYIKVIDIDAGFSKNAIPRDGFITVAVSIGQVENLKNRIEQVTGMFAEEYVTVKDNLKISMEKLEKVDFKYIEERDIKSLVNLVIAFPNAISEMNDVFIGVVNVSSNLGKLYIEDEVVYLISEIRGSTQSGMEVVVQKQEIISSLSDFDFEIFASYSSWKYQPDSKLRELAIKSFKNILQKDVKPYVLHAGLECGFFKEKRPCMDIISVGPNCRNFHCPTEEFEIDSMDRTYKAILELLKNVDF